MGCRHGRQIVGPVARTGPAADRARIRPIKETFQTALGGELNLLRVGAPLFVLAGTGINDNLNGVEQPVSFAIKSMNDGPCRDGPVAGQVETDGAGRLRLQARRGHLHRHERDPAGRGCSTDLHSIYVDQWDWERVMRRGERNVAFLEGHRRAGSTT